MGMETLFHAMPCGMVVMLGKQQHSLSAGFAWVVRFGRRQLCFRCDFDLTCFPAFLFVYTMVVLVHVVQFLIAIKNKFENWYENL